MQEQTGFDFTQINKNDSSTSEFKKQKQIYLAQRNARKKQALMQIKKEFADSSSSDDEKPPLKQPLIIKQNVSKEGSNTDSSQNTPDLQAQFKKQREKYKNERLMRRKEAVVNKRKQFGSSSSDEEQLPIKKTIKGKEQIKVQTSPRQPFKEEESMSFGYASLELNLARDSKEQRVGLLASVKLKEKHPQKKEIKERYEVQVPSKKGVNIWIQCWLQFKENSIELGQRIIPIYDITKAKMIIQPTQTGSFKIKVTIKEEEDVYLAVNPKKKNDLHFLDQYYYVFARIVTLKLQLMGRKPVNNPRIKSGLSEEILKEARLSGKLRKSSFFGGWQQKIGIISDRGLAIYKQGKDKPNLVVSPGSVKQIWTRFQSEKDSVVLKFLNGSSKLQLSVPIDNFLSRENWLYQIYALTPK